MTKTDGPLVSVVDSHGLFELTCPTCQAKPGYECTSLVSGCSLEPSVHKTRLELFKKGNG